MRSPRLPRSSHVHVLPVDETVWAGEDNYIVLATEAQTVFDGMIPYDEDFLGTPLCDKGALKVEGVFSPIAVFSSWR